MENNEQHILQKHLSQFLIKDVFNTISSDDILRVDSTGNWTHKGVKLTPMQIDALKQEANAFMNSMLWRVIRNELKYLAHKKGYMQSTTEADQIAAKMMEYITDVIETKLRSMIKV